MATLSELRKQAKAAPKFILTGQYNGQTVFIGEMKSLFDIPLVTQQEKAVQFSVGFDDERMKSRAWSISSKIDFSVKYL